MRLGPLDLLVVLRVFTRLQMGLIAALKDQLGARDWRFFTDVPRRGALEFGGDAWRFSVHGSGVRFEGAGVSVDANRGIDQFPSAFDAGRIVEYVRSQGADEVSWRGTNYRFDHDGAPALLRKVADAGEVVRVEEAEDELYTVRS